ncbi:MAG: GNAT family N-acetyltransferase [Alphaproteobacteria bacterium]|nr:GNAT family N-acetyltransferase [Alphaproteobacteria bacterium]
MGITITLESPDTEAARSLIAELVATLDHPDYPPESRHGYSVDTLIREGVHFFVMRAEGEVAGCGGIQFFSGFRGRGRGLGRVLLRHLEEHARARNCPVLRLETGIHQTGAIALYERAGFSRIPAFPPYKPDPVSLFFEKRLAP